MNNAIKQAVIIAAGHGISLGPLTQDRPKAMLPVLGKPIIIRLMDRLREAGITRFIVVVDEHGGAIAAYLNGPWVPDVKVQIVLQDAPRGTADALSCAAPAIHGPFLLASCDTLIPPEHIPSLIQRFQDFAGDMVVSTVLPTAERAANLPMITVDGPYVTEIFERKPRARHDLATFLVCACGQRILDHVGHVPLAQYNGDSLTHAIQNLILGGGKVSYLNAAWTMQLAQEIDLLAINKRFLREGRDTHILSELPGSVQVIPPVRIDPAVSVGQGAKIGPNVYLESGSHVGQDTVIWDSVILRNAAVANGEIVHGLIVTPQARLSEESGESEPEPSDQPAASTEPRPIAPRRIRPWKTLARRPVLDYNKYLAVEEHTVELPDGRVIPDWVWLITPDYVNVVVVTEDGRFLCFRQTKYAVEGVTLAVVGGYLEPDEDPLAAARRELREETGYIAAEWLALGNYRVDGNRGAGIGHFFLARGARLVGEIHSDDLEDQELVILSRSEVEAALVAGEFKLMPWVAIMTLALLRMSE